MAQDLTSSVLLEVKRVLEVLESKAMSASDVVAATGLPRYKVLAYMQLLEALGFLDKVYSRGTYRVYTLSGLGRELLGVLRSNGVVHLVIVKENSDIEDSVIGRSEETSVEESIVEGT